MDNNLSQQISQLRKMDWFNLQGLINLSIAFLQTSMSPDPNLSCLSVSLLGRGTFNFVYQLLFSDNTEIAASVSSQSEDLYSPEGRESEVQTMKFVRQSGLYPSIPVPEVYAWDITHNNPAGAPYILMSVIHGETLDSLKDDNDLRGLETLPLAKQFSIVKALANLKAALSKPVPFDHIGSIVDAAGSGYSIRPPAHVTDKRGPFRFAHELWRWWLEEEALDVIPKWCTLEKDQLSSPHQPDHTPQTFAEIFQLLSSLIQHFKVPQAYSTLVLNHPDLALRNIIFDKESLSSDRPKITGVVDWGGAEVLPLMLTGNFPEDLVCFGEYPFTQPDYPDEDWCSVPSDWTSTGNPTQWPEVWSRGKVVNHAPRVTAMICRFYLRMYFSACYAEQLDLLYGNASWTHTTLFTDAPYYLKFHEVMSGTWTKWLYHANWIRETYWRLKTLAGQGASEESSPIIGPNVYKTSVKPLVRDLKVFEEPPPPAEEGKYLVFENGVITNPETPEVIQTIDL